MADLFLGGSVNPATRERTATDATGSVTVPTDSLMPDVAPLTAPVFPDPTPTDRFAPEMTSAVFSGPTPTGALPADVTAVMPEVADGVAVRWVDVAAPWLADVDGDSSGTVREAAIVARVAIRYDETKADLVHDEEYEAVLFPLHEQVDGSGVVQVGYDDRDLRTDAPASVTYRFPDAKIATKTFFTQVERGLVDHLTRSLTLEIPANTDLKLYGRPGETADEFAARCTAFADEGVAALARQVREAKATRLRDQIDAAEDRADVLEAEAESKRSSEFLSTAGSLLGGLLGGRKSKGAMIGDMLGDAGTAARRRGSTSASGRGVDAAEHKVARLADQLTELEADAAAEITDKWGPLAREISSMTVSVERTDVDVNQLSLAWVPVA